MILLNTVQKKYGNKLVLSIPNLTLKDGIIGIVGNNGAGKTTLFYSILNLIKLNAGIVKIDDFEVKEEKWKKSTGVFLDDCFLIPYLNCREYLNLVANLHGVDSDSLEIKLKLFDSFLDSIPDMRIQISKLSKGNQKKIGLVGALLNENRLTILDEPFVNLDPKSQWELQNIILKIKNKNNNQMFLIASHQLDHISKISDKVIVLKSGEIIDSIDRKYLKIETLNRLLVD